MLWVDFKKDLLSLNQAINLILPNLLYPVIPRKYRKQKGANHKMKNKYLQNTIILVLTVALACGSVIGCTSPKKQSSTELLPQSSTSKDDKQENKSEEKDKNVLENKLEKENNDRKDDLEKNSNSSNSIDIKKPIQESEN